MNKALNSQLQFHLLLNLLKITVHDQIDFELILDNASLIIDTRDVFPDIKQNNLFKLGVGKLKPTKKVQK